MAVVVTLTRHARIGKSDLMWVMLVVLEKQWYFVKGRSCLIPRGYSKTMLTKVSASHRPSLSLCRLVITLAETLSLSIGFCDIQNVESRDSSM